MFLAGRSLLEKLKDELKDQHGHVHDHFKGEQERERPGGKRHAHRHEHARKMQLTLWSIAIFGFVLGFVHEEEFALLALAVGGVDPLLLMLTYASAMMAGLIGITLTTVRIYGRLELRLGKYEHLIPKVSGVILSLMAKFLSRPEMSLSTSIAQDAFIFAKEEGPYYSWLC